MKKFGKLMVAMLFLGTLAACGGAKDQGTKDSAATSSSASSDKPLAGETLKFALSPNFVPFESAELNDKGEMEVVGFDVDLVNQLSEDLGFEYEIIETEFKGLVGELQSGRADFVISGMTATEERRKSVDFSDPYFYTKTGVIFPKDQNIETVTDMQGKKIAVSFGTTFEQQATDMGAEVVAFDSGAAVLQDLYNGRVDGAMMDATKAAIEAEKNPDYAYIIFSDEELGITEANTFNIAFPQGSELVEVFNEYINKYQEDGTMDKIAEKWMGQKFIEESK
ncbi:ABC-type amino acid transport substrate-binding protein [Enterococcus sp. PF1-24]|uniref:substrate-binding periplasmic protein n=1 Tax=unclassified Enterococcus TaxID=2608891 RepID=UPI002473F352|nr:MULTISPECIES: transporter substrate-binding domain-containing protein [unclassified Enterococcus]MDH6363454.1 ABC-type amino acid transport substrate-binding protein [Enterococcus sp. PFB1-1]MDH6400548.1 ABC-type amino acid transport substrate-binding protein [Enterococcus sp. PF1-24]